MTNKDIIIRKANLSEARDIAKIHVDSIPSGFLSTLGEEFLSKIYENSIKKAFTIVAIEKIRKKEKIIGFVSGTENFSKLKMNLMKNYNLKIILILLIKIINNPRTLIKIIETFFRKESKSKKINLNPELTAIAVSSNYRNKGIGKSLFMSLCKEFKENNILKFKMIVGENLKGSVNFYKSLGAKPVRKIEIHKGQKSIVHIFKIP